MALETTTKESFKTGLFPRRLHIPLGFRRSSSALLWFIQSGSLVTFCLARVPYLAIDNFYRTHAAPGEWFYFRQPLYRNALAVHLLSVIPAGLLAAVQFVPLLRSKAPWLHRATGYAIVLLVTSANISGLVLARRAFGGTIETRIFVDVLAIATSACMLLSCINIRRGRVAEHRAWMLRCVSEIFQQRNHASLVYRETIKLTSSPLLQWSYLGTPLTIRLLVPLLALSISLPNNSPYYMAVSCEQITFTGLELGDNPDAAAVYAACRENPSGWTAVKANLLNPSSVTEVMAGLQIGFGAAGMLALIIHAVVVEMYLSRSKSSGVGGASRHRPQRQNSRNG